MTTAKRVDYDAVANLDNQPLGHIATTLEGGKQALVISSDPPPGSWSPHTPNY
jgi:hypothetical protein